jgi:hypothetical protein
MFFRKSKKEELSDQHAVYQEREAPRFVLKAGITIDGYEGEGQLGNISISGCCMVSATYAAIAPDEVYQLKIIPAADENIDPFSLKFRANWTKSSETLFLAGFSLEQGQSNTQLKRYSELLRASGVQPDFGNMSPERRNEN